MKLFNQKDNLPHNFLAEKTILSCLLLNSSIIELTTNSLCIDTFYFRNHQEIFKAITFLYENNIPIDIITLTTFLQDNGLIRKSGGIKVLLSLINQIPNLTYINYYICLVNEKFIRRCIIKLGYKAINSSYITNLNVQDIILTFENELILMMNKLNPNKIYTTGEFIYKIFHNLKEKKKFRFIGIPSGFYKLDSLTNGFQNSELIIIAGRPSIGKTAFSLTLSMNAIKYSKMPILFFSLEMSKEQLIYRLLAMETNISQSQLKYGKLYKLDWIKLSKVLKILSKLPFFIDDKPNLNISSIQSKIKVLFSNQQKIGLIIIDYLQLIENSRLSNKNRAYQLSQITRSLKNLAREFKLPIIALSQLNRNVELRLNKKPILADLKESGSIEQDADLVILLSKHQNLSFKNLNNLVNPYQIIIDVAIAKQRNGPIGTIQLKFDQKKVKYLNL